ncbi:aspartyl/asparaginyl beta-hydroxylase domain-containing protein [Sphingomonas sp. MMS24-J45]|uniref:aspartyl/asparaginyl beta-hydroxylase domain-containing protein n=1 Tax=Sphingomonas sp. MMS24-J45 TaxID=3238806 RepID=UPI00384BD706
MTVPVDLSALFDAARRASAAGRTDEAISHFEAIVAQQGDHAAALNALGTIALQRRDAHRALALFERAAAADPKAAPLHLNIATAARALKDDARERAALLAVLECDQRDLMALIRLAELHERLGEEADAAARWSGVLAVAQMMPDRPAALAPVLQRAAHYVASRTQHLRQAVATAIETRHPAAPPDARRKVTTAIDAMLGGRRIYANVCSGLHVPFLPADEYFAREHFPWLPEIEAQTGAIGDEFLRLYGADGARDFRPYVEMEPGTPENRWTPLDHSLDWSALHLYRHGARDEALAERCPATVAALEALPLPDLPLRAPSAFFSVLRPHTRIPPHTGVTNIRATVHLPLIVPRGCGFRVGGETREWEVGRAFVFDDTIEHEAWNDSDEMRAILIFDVWNPHLGAEERAMIATFYATTDAARGDGFAGA